MTQIAALKTTKEEKVREAKRAFILGLLDISWRLAAAVLVPFFIGLAFGQKIIGLLIGLALAVTIIIKLGLDSNQNV